MRKQNVDRHSNGVVNKIIKKDIGKHSTKCTGDNLDKSAEFIFNNSTKRLKTKILRNEELWFTCQIEIKNSYIY